MAIRMELSGDTEAEIERKAREKLGEYGVDPADYDLSIDSEAVLTIAEQIICWRADVTAYPKVASR